MLVGVGTATAGDRVEPYPLGVSGGTCGTVAVSSTRSPAALSGVAKVLYLNRCSGGCTVTAANQQDAPHDVTAVSGIPRGNSYSIPEFKNFSNQVGAAADAEWAEIVACVAQTYSYFDIHVTDVRPASGNYGMSIVGGTQDRIGLDINGLLGISQLDCSGPLDNVISFVLSEAHRPYASTPKAYVRDLCTTIAHEAGHAFGLQHEFRFLEDNTSACSDPMSYDTGTCNPDQRYFRNKIAACGRFKEEPCDCPNNVANTHGLLFNVFGPGTPTVPVPSVAFTTPATANGSISTFVAVDSGSRRGVNRLELHLNGWKWLTVPGAVFVRGGGQPDPSPYAFQLPSRVPDGIYDIEVRSYDDVGAMGTASIRATKGAPCTSADTCLTGQRCDAGRCLWDPPTGQFGESCTYNEFCASNLCTGTSDSQICTQPCIPGVADSCPPDTDTTCVATSPGAGVCFPAEDSGGCCRVGASTESTRSVAPLALGVIVLAWSVGRRRARA